MLLEMEEILYFMGKIFNASYVSEDYCYLFFTKAIADRDDEEKWEGMVGELKNNIKKQGNEIIDKQQKEFDKQQK